MDTPQDGPTGPQDGRKAPGPPSTPGPLERAPTGPQDAPAGGPPSADSGPRQLEQDADGPPRPEASDPRTGAARPGRVAGYRAHPAQVDAGHRTAGRVAAAHRAADATRGTKRPPLMRAQAALVRVSLRVLRQVEAEIGRCERVTADEQDTAAAAGKPPDAVAMRLPDADTRWWLDVASKAVLGMTSAQLRREQLAIAAERAKRGLPAAPGDPTLPDDQLVERVLLELPEEAFAAIAAKRAAGIAPDSDRSALVLAGQPHTRADRR